MKESTASGGCLCGGVRYQVHGELRPVIYCHCSQCRRTSGHFVAATAALNEHFELLVDDQLRWYRSSDKASRGFCQRCGSNLLWRPEGEDYVSIWAGTLDQPTGLSAAEHIYVDDAGDYYEITDGLPQHPQGESSFKR